MVLQDEATDAAHSNLEAGEQNVLHIIKSL